MSDNILNLISSCGSKEAISSIEEMFVASRQTLIGCEFYLTQAQLPNFDFSLFELGQLIRITKPDSDINEIFIITRIECDLAGSICATLQLKGSL